MRVWERMHSNVRVVTTVLIKNVVKEGMFCQFMRKTNMTPNDLKLLQMTLYVSNKLTEVIWSHLSHEATKLAIL